MIKKLTWLIFIMMLAVSTFATDFIPSGDINGKGIYAIKNMTDINGTRIFQNGNRVVDASMITNLNVNSSDWWNTNIGSLTDVQVRWFLWTAPGILTFNEGRMNDTIDARDLTYSVSGRYLDMNSRVISLNEVVLNATIDDRIPPVVGTLIGDNIYLYNDSTKMHLNETKLNQTIDDRQISTAARGTDGIYLYNSSTTYFFNATKMNNTIDLRSTYSEDSPYLSILNHVISFDEALMNATIDARVPIASGVLKGDNIYLYNDSTLMHLNETKLNKTIDERMVQGSQKNSDGIFLYNDSDTYFFNATKLNDTIDARSGGSGKSADGNYLYNDSTVMYFNVSKMNNTIDARSINSVGEDTTPSLGGDLTAHYSILIAQGNKTCYDGATCNHYVMYNGTHMVIV